MSAKQRVKVTDGVNAAIDGNVGGGNVGSGQQAASMFHSHPIYKH